MTRRIRNKRRQSRCCCWCCTYRRDGLGEGSAQHVYIVPGDLGRDEGGGEANQADQGNGQRAHRCHPTPLLASAATTAATAPPCVRQRRGWTGTMTTTCYASVRSRCPVSRECVGKSCGSCGQVRGSKDQRKRDGLSKRNIGQGISTMCQESVYGAGSKSCSIPGKLVFDERGVVCPKPCHCWCCVLPCGGR